MEPERVKPVPHTGSEGMEEHHLLSVLLVRPRGTTGGWNVQVRTDSDRTFQAPSEILDHLCQQVGRVTVSWFSQLRETVEKVASEEKEEAEKRNQEMASDVCEDNCNLEDLDTDEETPNI